MSAPPREVVGLGLDIGSTRIKLARLSAAGTLEDFETQPTPALTGDGLVREGDPERWLEVIESVLAESDAGGGLPLGIACQRSSFVLWRKRDGRPVSALVSWQDRRAAPWCEQRRAREPHIRSLTGLPLSPHYAGPKLAFLLERSPELRAGMERGEVLFGTLDAWLLWHWSRGAVHETDLGMAARTLMVETERGAWSDELLELYGVPKRALPTIVASGGREHSLARFDLCWRASLADQAASVLSVLHPDQDGALWNLGTGCFVLRPTGPRFEPRTGYLAGPLCAGPPGAGGTARFALEGTINGGGKTVARFGAGPTVWPAEDPSPEGFCLPDENGLGAPHWRADATLTFSAESPRDAEARRRLVLEGLLFRAFEILGELVAPASRPQRLLVSGGLAREACLPSGMATLMQTPVEILEEGETTLLGAARMAAGLPLPADLGTRRVDPDAAPAWLRTKARAWRAWMTRAILGGASPPRV